MGKQRITQLLEQLQENQQQDLAHAAAIFTVAQVAVNQLETQVLEPPALPLPPSSLAALPAAALDQAELKRRYGSHVACRKAAKMLGIRFSKTPSWQKLAAAFTYQAAAEQLIQAYLQEHPSPDLQHVAIEIKLG
ncbi:MAG: hypothetical protein KME07_12470 [Pegethrix bostrychoides GSE-TBD4-15B]|jgi:hypothetical protein|uniref:Uncharacterized protein n=1 Tax=Pegethrix bostrychoides GSE-TBD4-15B TaxID=2839662 RepID=A0A951PB46_9CYAN|nr:hypothetical protein [Pegethrix bostrychoides GSE-TBD4-15B]